MPNFSKHKSRITNVLTVLGTRCQIFPVGNDTIKAETLVPWMNDKSILIDKYDARCWLTEIGLDTSGNDKFTEDAAVEALCDEERYVDLIRSQRHFDSISNPILNSISTIVDETSIIPEVEAPNEDLTERNKIPNEGEYTSVHFSYDDDKNDDKEDIVEDTIQKENEEDIPYQCPADLIIPDNIELPETEKQAAKIEKTAAFIANNGTQMEILVKTKQSKNDQFQFLNYDNKLNPFYKFLLEKIKSAEYIPARRHLCHLTKREETPSDNADPPRTLPKIDITNTAYFKLINKYRSDNTNAAVESTKNESGHDCNGDSMITEESSTSDTKPGEDKSCNDEEREKLYTAMYEQYYTYYYNYYYQLHNNSALSQDSSLIRIEEDSKSLAINAAVYAAKAGVEQHQKDQEEKNRVALLRTVKADKKKQQCTIIRYVHYVMKHGNELEYRLTKCSEQLQFLDPDNDGHCFYQHCLRRARKSVLGSGQTPLQPPASTGPSYPRWQDYCRAPAVGITSGPKLVVDSGRSCISNGVEEQKLVELAELISGLLSAEKVGRQKSVPRVVDLRATRKRKVTEFMERIRRKADRYSESDTEDRHKRSKKSSSKRRKHRHK